MKHALPLLLALEQDKATLGIGCFSELQPTLSPSVFAENAQVSQCVSWLPLHFLGATGYLPKPDKQLMLICQDATRL